MNKRSLITHITLAFVAILLLTLIYGLTVKTWHFQTVDSIGEQGGYSSLALDSSGNPHISYTDWVWGAKNHTLKYATLTSSGWSSQQVDFGEFYHHSIVLDKNGTPYIWYYDKGNNVLKVASQIGSNWSIRVINPGPQTGVFSNLVIGSDGVLRFCYYDKETHGIEYVETTNSYWRSETIANSTEGPNQMSLALDSLNNPHIFFGNYYAKYSNNLGANWTINNVNSNSSFYWSSRLVLDSKGNPAIVLDTKSEDMDLVHWSGSDWVMEKIDSYGGAPSLALDSNGNFHVSYNSDGGIRYSSKVGSSWFTQNINIKNSLSDPSLVFDAAGNPRMSIYQRFDFGHSIYTYAISYATLSNAIDLQGGLLYVADSAVVALFMIVLWVILQTRRWLRNQTDMRLPKWFGNLRVLSVDKNIIFVLFAVDCTTSLQPKPNAANKKQSFAQPSGCCCV